MLGLDTESTGVEPTDARIVTAAVLYIGPGPGRRETQPRDWLINPGVPIPAEATAVHGISDEIAAGGMEPGMALVEIAGVIEEAAQRDIPVVAFNATFDLTLLDSELARHGLDPLGFRYVIDPLVIDRAVDKYRKGSRKLDAVCRHYQIDPGDSHQASADCHAAARLAWKLAARYPEQVGNVTLAELHAKQQQWQAEWAAHYQEYLRTRGGQPDAQIDGTWPIRGAARAHEAAA